jgi:hypothetical protein
MSECAGARRALSAREEAGVEGLGEVALQGVADGGGEQVRVDARIGTCAPECPSARSRSAIDCPVVRRFVVPMLVGDPWSRDGRCT